MKKRFIYTLGVLCTCLCLTACGSSNSYQSSNNGSGIAINTSDAYYDTGGSYGSYSSNDSYADYSYSFGASGKCDGRETFPEFLQTVEDYVTEKDGYLDSVRNNYYNYTNLQKRYYLDSEKRYKYEGYISFQANLAEEDVAEFIQMLEDFCKTNKLTVSTYTQSVMTYRQWDVIDEYPEDYYDNRWKYENSNIITESDLESRLKYSTVSVSLSYYQPRAKIAGFFMGLQESLDEIWNSFGEIFQIAFVIIIIGLAIIFVVVLGFRMIIRTRYGFIHRLKKAHPEYFENKKIEIIHTSSVKKNVNPEDFYETPDEPNGEKPETVMTEAEMKAVTNEFVEELNKTT